MLTVNGRKYAKNKSELVDSLFQPGGTAHGFYRKQRYGIVLMDQHKEPKVFLVANSHNEFFFISCYRQLDGKIRYMFDMSDKDKEWAGLSDSPTNRSFEAQKAWEMSFNYQP